MKPVELSPPSETGLPIGSLTDGAAVFGGTGISLPDWSPLGDDDSSSLSRPAGFLRINMGLIPPMFQVRVLEEGGFPSTSLLLVVLPSEGDIVSTIVFLLIVS